MTERPGERRHVETAPVDAAPELADAVPQHADLVPKLDDVVPEHSDVAQGLVDDGFDDRTDTAAGAGR